MSRARYKAKYKRERESVLRRRWFWDAVLGVLFCASLGYLLFCSPAFKISQVKITGPGDEQTENLFSLLNTQKGKILFLVNGKGLEQIIMREFPDIGAAEIKKQLPKTLFLEIKKREPVARICDTASSTDCALIDITGAVFGDSISKHLDLVEILSDGKQIESNQLAAVLQINNFVSHLPTMQIKQFVIEENQRIDAVAVAGLSIYFSVSGDLDLALTKLKLLLEQEISPAQLKNLKYIDLRFSKVYYQ